MRKFAKLIAVLTVLSMLAAPMYAQAGIVDKYKEENPLDSFPKWELIMDGSLLVTFIMLQKTDEPTPGMGPPQEGSFDYEVNQDFLEFRGSTYIHLSDWLAGISIGGPFILYSSDILFGKPGIKFPFTKLMAFGEAQLITNTLTEATKKGIGRDRPDNSDTLSFFSGHSSTAFTAASFFALDISAWLRNDVLADKSKTTRNLAATGSFAGLYTIAGLTAFYRIPAHKHYASDVIIGSIVGAAVGNLVYLAHFTLDGERRSDLKKNAGNRPYEKLAIFPLTDEKFVGIGFEYRF